MTAPKPRKKVPTSRDFRNWKRQRERLHAKAIASKPACPVCGEVIDDPKDIVINKPMGPCHLTCILIEWALGKKTPQAMKPKPKLRRCPFCGGKRLFSWVGYSPDRHYVGCKCGANGPMKPTRAEAREAWQRQGKEK